MSGQAAEPEVPTAPDAPESAEELMGWIRLLTDEVGPRRPTGSEEHLAARLLAARLTERGLRPRVEPFLGYSTFALPFALILGAAAAPALFPPRLRATRVGLAAAAAAALASEGSLTRAPLTGLLSRRRSQNVVATIEPSGRAERTLCLMAHMDSSRSGLLFDPRFVGWMGRWITFNSALVVAGALAEPFALRSRAVRRGLMIARSTLVGGLALLLEREARGEEVPGANDNASGCAVAATLATEIAARPLTSTRVVICLTGCEESGTLGARAFIRDHGTRDWLFLNFDNVGSGGTLRYLRREGVISRWDADAGLVAVADGVRDRRPDLRMAPEDSPAGLTYDASPVMASGGRALTLSIQDGSIPNLHWPTDTVANIDPDGVRRALAAGREVAAAVNRGAADRPPSSGKEPRI